MVADMAFLEFQARHVVSISGPISEPTETS
jgi:hypothetical protein